MSLARAFTKRTKRPEVAPLPMREGSVRYTPGTISRAKISMPTELLSTTNVQALNAPDIRSVSNSSSNSSLRSSDDSDFSHIDRSFLESPMTSPDTSSIETSPVMPAPEHTPATPLTSSTPKRSATSTGYSRSVVSVSSNSSTEATPNVPQRAMSHSKYAHQELARKRSINNMAPPPTSLTTPSVNLVRDSHAFFSGNVEAHPFGKELAQVNEAVEEFGGVRTIYDEEEELMRSKGLQKFSVEDYINEIQGLYGGVFEGRMVNAWI